MLMMSLLYIFLFIQIDIFFGKEFSEAIEKKQVGKIIEILLNNFMEMVKFCVWTIFHKC